MNAVPHARAALGAISVLALAALANAQWQQRQPATSPAARRGVAMAFAPNVGGVLLFGGTGNPFPSNETWRYDGSNWSLLAPVTQPSARIETEMVYDLARGVCVLYGGTGSTGSNLETWEWNGLDWTQIATAQSPGARSRHGLAYDSVRGRVVMYGGIGGGVGIPTNQTWEYDGTNWMQMTPAANPGPLDRPAMCYDAAIGKTVLFGGAFSSTIHDATWTYDGSNWTQVVITGPKPSARNAAKMVFDDMRGVCVLTGGQDASTIFADTWEFDGVGWTQQPTVKQPTRDHGLAFSPGDRQVVEFGGFTAAPNTLSNQTWDFGARWNTYGQGCAGSNGVPALSMPDAGRLGGNYTLDLANLNPSPLVAVMVLGLIEIPAPGVALDFFGMTGCTGWTSPDVLVNVATSGGLASYTWTPVFGTVGDRIYAQALCLDPAVNPAWLTASNAVATTLGN